MSFPKPSEVFGFIGRNAKRVAVTIVGGVVVVAGLAMLVFPGPAVVVIPAGFAILATEYAWAAVALKKSKKMAVTAGEKTKSGATLIKEKVAGTKKKRPRRVR
ncbi:MAG TPA: PGPGW domain-containing protein [Acidimicrobiales bacterium]|nr:PGPGW domain-containing protein [Acidimicrobiales bacterium]